MPVIVTAALQATWLDPSTDGAAVLDAPAPRLTLAALPR